MCSFDGAIAKSALGVAGKGVDTMVQAINDRNRMDTARENASRAREESARSLQDASRKMAIASMDSARTVASAEARMGGSGFAVSSTTLSRVVDGSRQSSMADILQIRANAFAQADRWNRQAGDFDRQARYARISGTFNVARGMVDIAATAIGADFGSGKSVEPTQPTASYRPDAPEPTQVRDF